MILARPASPDMPRKNRVRVWDCSVASGLPALAVTPLLTTTLPYPRHWLYVRSSGLENSSLSFAQAASPSYV
ncbi:hypothetical protein Slala05_63510 [Streptomyces lavendulae subsp. lavendulae]|nr:hypothetical protein Slala05_63510 [Streptomyces lavendulae subsp. lavendulae]